MDTPTLALRRRGMRDCQWRSLDGNAFHPLGLAEEQLHLLEVLLRFSLLSGSPRIKAHERQTIDPSQVLAARLRREPGLLSEGVVSDVEPCAWRRDLLAAMEPVAGLLGGLHGDTGGTSLRMQQASVANREMTPLAQALMEMRASGEGFQDDARGLREAHGRHWRTHTLDPEPEAGLLRRVDEPKRRPTDTKAADDVDLDTFLLTPPRGCERIRYLLPRAASWMLSPAFSIC